METARKAIGIRNGNCRLRFRSRATGIFFIGVSTLRTDPARIVPLGLVSKRSDHVCPNPYQADIPQDTVVDEVFNFVFALKVSIEMISVRTGMRGSQ
jgi:hypothetical protein